MKSKLLVRRGDARSGATFSRCGLYRYDLWRVWDESLPKCLFIGLNPSTADEIRSDPTVTRCINFATKWKCGSLVMLNLFAWRATDPQEMKQVDDSIGMFNDAFVLDHATEDVAVTVCAWGNHGQHRNRSALLVHQLQAAGVDLYALRLNKSGEPCHPLYLPASLNPRLWDPQMRVLGPERSA